MPHPSFNRMDSDNSLYEKGARLVEDDTAALRFFRQAQSFRACNSRDFV